MLEAETLMTAEQLERIPDDDHRYELVKGRLIKMPPAGEEQAELAAKIVLRLGLYVEQRHLGKILVDGGFCLECRPDTVRGPDVAFIASEHVSPERRRGFVRGAPDLAVEILSPSNTASEVVEKVVDYLSHGTQLVWVLDPRTRTVSVYHPDGSARLLRPDETLEGEAVVPGFSIRVSELL